MRKKLILRNAVCLASVRPAAFDVAGFSAKLELGEEEQQVLLPDLSVTEWRRARLQILPDRVQLGFKEDADAEFIRRALSEFLQRKDELMPDAPLMFNAGLQLIAENDEEDPSKGFLDVDALAAELGGEGNARGGVTLVFQDQTSRWWVELSPDPDQSGVWIYDFNRRITSTPEEGEARDAVLDWFATIDVDLVSQFETLSKRSISQ